MCSRSRLGLVVLLTLAAAIPAGRAQNPATPAYQGLQLELVRGAEDGLATAHPKIRHVYLASPKVLAVVVDAQSIPLQGYVPYVAQPGDEVVPRGPLKLGAAQRETSRYRILRRGGQEIGDLIGPRDSHFLPRPSLEGAPLDIAWASRPASYALRSVDDRAYAKPLTPTAVFRKSAPEMREWVVQGGEQRSARHHLFLQLPRPLAPGKTYRLEFDQTSPFTGPVEFTFDDRRLRTEALHVNLLGHHPRETTKLAHLYHWLGSGGDADLSSLKTFELVNAATGHAVFTGKVRLQQAAVPGKRTAIHPAPETAPRELPMSVYALDYSAFSTPGVYRVVVPGLGASFPFRIDETVWRDAARVALLGFLNQRAGIALGPPHTEFRRPRSLHPEDGFKVHRTDPVRFYDPSIPNDPSGNAFRRIQHAILEDTHVPEAWGGWHDAADFDRSILPQNHTFAVHAMLDLYESNPAYFAALDLNLPAADARVPDIIDEALWCMDLFLRLQQPDGGVPSAVESVEHPSAAPSYLETLPTALTPPTPQTCHLYAAAAAHVAFVVEKYDSARAAVYRASALRAMAWAEANPGVPNIYVRPDQRPPAENANLAAAHLYRLTGEARWHELFKSTLAEIYPDGFTPRTPPYMEGRYTGPRGIEIYAHLPVERADHALRETCRAVLVAAGERRLAAIATWPLRMNPAPENWGERGDQPVVLVAAHRITGDARFLNALVQASQPALGANPANASYTWGIGSRHVRPYQIDPNRSATPFPVGITTYGYFPPHIWGAAGVEKVLGDVLYPAWTEWPAPESIFNVRYAPISEYAIGHLVAPLLARAYLAQAFGEPEAQSR
jgi:endoglucanase